MPVGEPVQREAKRSLSILRPAARGRTHFPFRGGSKAQPTEAVGCTIEGGQEAKTQLVVYESTRLGLAVWDYAFAWFVVNEGVKVAAYRIFGPRRIGLLARIPRNILAVG